MKSKLIKNFLYQAIYQMTIIILPIITIPIVSHALGAEGIGIYNYINSIVTYFILFAGLGLSNYGIREISIVRENKQELSSTFWHLELFNLFIVIFIMICYVLFLFFVQNKLLFTISGISLLASLFDISWFYYGIEDFKLITIINLLIKILSFISILFFINSSNDLWVYFLIQSVSVLFSNLSLWLFLSDKIIWIKPNFKKVVSHFVPALKYFIGKISITIYTNMNKTLLGILVSSIAVGIYSNSLQLITISVAIIGTMDTVLMPHMTKLYSNNKSNLMIETMEKSINIQLFFSIPLMFGIILTNKKMIPWFFGSDFLLLNKTVPMLSLLVIIMPLGISIVKQYLMPMNRIRQFNISVIVAAIVSLTLNLFLLPKYGIYGAVISTLISELLVTLIRVYDLLKNTSFRFDVISILSYIVCSIAMYLVVYCLSISMNSSIITTLFQSFLGVVIYFILSVVFKINPILSFFKND